MAMGKHLNTAKIISQRPSAHERLGDGQKGELQPCRWAARSHDEAHRPRARTTSPTVRTAAWCSCCLRMESQQGAEHELAGIQVQAVRPSSLLADDKQQPWDVQED